MAILITKHPQDNKPKPGEEAIFIVEAEGSKSITFTWERIDGNRILPQQHTEVYKVISEGVFRSTLTIPDVTSDDIGVYRCKVRDGDEQDNSDPAYLSVGMLLFNVPFQHTCCSSYYHAILFI